MKLSRLFKKKLKPDVVRVAVADKIGKAYSTITRWYYYDNDKFARLDVIEAVREVTGLTQEEMFENTKEVK